MASNNELDVVRKGHESKLISIESPPTGLFLNNQVGD